MSDEEPQARTGSYADLARRVDGVEKRVTDLTGTIVRVELNQQHAEELTKLRFDALDTGMKAISGQLNEFVRRIESILSGEVVTPQSRRGEEILREYEEWRTGLERWRNQVDDRFVAQDAISASKDKAAATLARNWGIAGSAIGAGAFFIVQLLSGQ